MFTACIPVWHVYLYGMYICMACIPAAAMTFAKADANQDGHLYLYAVTVAGNIWFATCIDLMH